MESVATGVTQRADGRAGIVAVVELRKTRRVTVLCPYCCHLHYHRYPYSTFYPGRRRADCGRGTYEVYLP